MDVDADKIQDAAGSGTFNLLSVYVEIDSFGEERKSVAVEIVLPAGATKEKLMVNVSSDGHYLKILYTWPSALTNIEKRLKFRLCAERTQKTEKYCPVAYNFS